LDDAGIDDEQELALDIMQSHSQYTTCTHRLSGNKKTPIAQSTKERKERVHL